MKLAFRNADGTIFKQVSEKTVRRPDIEDLHFGVTSAHDYVARLQRSEDGKSLYFRHCWYTYQDGGSWGEYALINASMDDPIGYIHGDVVDMISGRQILPVKGIHDQTAFMRTWGEMRYAPNLDKLERYLDNRDIEKLSSETISAVHGKINRSNIGYPGDWMRPYQPGGEDHYGDTNTAGSPNACYSNRTYVAWMVDPENPNPLITLFDWLKIQYGTTIFEEDRGLINRPGRPQLLFSPEGGFLRPYKQTMLRHKFSYGTISGREFGRHEIPTVLHRDVGDNRLDWIGKRLMWQSGDQIPYGGYVRFGNRVTAEGWNGHDAEHDFRNHPVDALCMLTPSIFAKDLRRCMLETAIEENFDSDGNSLVEMPQDHDWNSRARSWRLFNFVMGGYVLDDDRITAIARRLRDRTLAGDATPRDFAKEWIWAGSKYRNDDDILYESVWQTAPGVAAAEQAADLEDNPGEKLKWQQLHAKGLRILDKAVVYENIRPVGISKSIQIDSNGARPIGNEVGWLGVHHWCVAAAWSRPWAQIGWGELQRQHRYFDVDRASEQCFEWHWRSVLQGG